jgi:hypothetical protein
MSVRDLSTFVRNPNFSTEREKMMEHWLCHKIYEACFARSIRPLIYTTEYDRGGFDIAVGVGTSIREFQLKVMAENASTREWHISSTLLWPRIDMLDAFCILSEGNAYAGRMGGVILMEVAADDCQITKVDMYYCDIAVLAFRYLRNGPDDQAARQMYEVLQRPLTLNTDSSRGRISISRSCFVRLPSVASVLTLAGLPLDNMLPMRHMVRESFRPIVSGRDYDAREPGESWHRLEELEAHFERISSIVA